MVTRFARWTVAIEPGGSRADDPVEWRDALVVVRAGSLEIVGAGDDAIDAAVVGLASDDDHIITSDADDIQRLVGAAGITST